jgi:hypothetical protein
VSKGGSHVKRKAEVKVVTYKPRVARACQQATRSWGSGDGEEARGRFSLTALKRNQPCKHLDLGLAAFRSVKQYLFFLKSPSMWYFYGNPSQQVQK